MKLSKSFLKCMRRVGLEERGSQIVELALVLPVILVMLGALAEFGRYFYTYSTLTSAVRAGARHASKWQKDESWTFPETSKMVVYGDFGSTAGGPILPGLSESNVVIQTNGAGVNDVDSVTVKIVGYQYTPLFDLGQLTGISTLSMSINMNASATMKQLFKGPVIH
jgi:hypothetical protein